MWESFHRCLNRFLHWWWPPSPRWHVYDTIVPPAHEIPRLDVQGLYGVTDQVEHITPELMGERGIVQFVDKYQRPGLAFHLVTLHPQCVRHPYGEICLPAGSHHVVIVSQRYSNIPDIWSVTMKAPFELFMKAYVKHAYQESFIQHTLRGDVLNLYVLQTIFRGEDFVLGLMKEKTS